MAEEKYQIKIPDMDYFKKMIKCQDACPVNTPSGSYVNAIADGDYIRSYALARGPNPFAPICGLICSHPCEKACRRGSIDEPVSIRALKRFAVESFMKATNSNVYKSAELSTAFGSGKGVPTGKKVAVIGSGPAGIASAHDLARLGYRVTVFESQPTIGGMFYFGIPAYRLPRDIIKFDMDSILSLGIDVRLNVTVGKEVTLDDLFDEGFEAALIAVGAQLSRPLPIEGTDLEGVFQGVSFLRRVGLGERLELGKRVIVIGGGNVAMDVARTVRRLRIKDVHSVCLEGLHEMPADKLEISEAIEEGITLHPRKGPQRVVGKDGKVTGLRVIDVASVFDSSGRFNPQYVEGSESIIEADAVLTAIGQASDNACLKGCKGFKATRWGTIVVDDNLSIGMPGVYAAGDVATGPGIVIGAVASGQKAAKAIDKYLRGKERKTIKKAKMTALRDYKKPAEDYINITREEPPVLDPEKRLTGFTQVEVGYPEDMAVEQANRCLKCNINTIFNGELCIACGGCVDVCPMNCLKLTSLSNLAGDENLDKLIQNRYNISKEDYEKNKDEILSSMNGAAIIKDEDKCIRCGLCAKRCPTNTITMEKFEFEEVFANE
jgi:NADPH-dependent glutamate synthase beta subunit-like oxidoreductase/formate hydrogenlyase subunit 6/NADH:ubiquinone oxidoreductase subunit I